MPYITKARRDAARQVGASGHHPIMETPGELNYEITLKLVKYIEQHGLSYQTINDILGALEGAKAEFYRRVAVPYENAKMAENGDVYS